MCNYEDASILDTTIFPLQLPSRVSHPIASPIPYVYVYNPTLKNSRAFLNNMNKTKHNSKQLRTAQ